MPCLIVLLALLAPRAAIVLIVVFSDYIGHAFQTTVWPLLGFLFMPFTTLAYAWAKNEGGSVEGAYLIVVVVAVLVDMGTLGGPTRSARYRKYWRR